MKKTLVVIAMIMFSTMVFAENRLNKLEKYSVPANISLLEWKLLKIQVASFSDTLQWDDFGLITSIELSSTQNPEKILVLFTVNNSQYIKLNNDTLEKVFTNAIEGAYNIIKITIPEADLGENVSAMFLTVGSAGKTVATYNNGKIKLIK